MNYSAVFNGKENFPVTARRLRELQAGPRSLDKAKLRSAAALGGDCDYGGCTAFTISRPSLSSELRRRRDREVEDVSLKAFAADKKPHMVKFFATSGVVHVVEFVVNSVLFGWRHAIA